MRCHRLPPSWVALQRAELARQRAKQFAPLAVGQRRLPAFLPPVGSSVQELEQLGSSTAEPALRARSHDPPDLASSAATPQCPPDWQAQGYWRFVPRRDLAIERITLNQPQ